MFTYIYLGTNDLERAIRFYDATLASLRLRRCVTGDPDWDRMSAGWGTYENNGARELALWVGKPFDRQPATVGNGSMVAFHARSWTEVDDFHAIALAHGGPFEGPEEVAYVLERSNAQGFVGASSFERLPVEQAIVGLVKEFKKLRVDVNKHNRVG